MDQKEFKKFREAMGKTQTEIASILGQSVRTIQSFEQGWRKVPNYIERQMFFLFAMKLKKNHLSLNCWDIVKCPDEKKEKCPSHEFHLGTLCWFINGTYCHLPRKKKWDKKLELCKKCQVFRTLF